MRYLYLFVFHFVVKFYTLPGKIIGKARNLNRSIGEIPGKSGQ